MSKLLHNIIFGENHKIQAHCEELDLFRGIVHKSPSKPQFLDGIDK